MRKLKIPAAAWTTATGEKLKETRLQRNPEEIDLQLLADSLAPGESVEIALFEDQALTWHAPGG
jgi:hypothetical protein